MSGTTHQHEMELAARKQQLLIRSAELRVTLAHQSQTLQGPLAWADQAVSGTRWLRNHPQWPLGALLLLAVLRPRRALAWAGRLWWGWGLYQRARSWLARGER
ncbi:MAG: YqjK-like family protein [Hylemonella sp.]|nr:YqjK-like family protein [Hylemonella sp.]MDP1936778.1 YqjK-like family protein [Hylemonella sp.]